MITLTYLNDSNQQVTIKVKDWDAVIPVAEGLVNAPIDLDYIDYVDGDNVGTFNLNTFERC